MRARSWAGSDVPSCATARPAAPATSAASSDNRFMAQNIHAGALMAGRRRLITFPLVSEFVFGTHNAAFVQVMYEQYLRDPASVSDDWRQLFDNGRLAELPVIPTNRAEVLGDEGRGTGDGSIAAAPPRPPPHLLPPPDRVRDCTGRARLPGDDARLSRRERQTPPPRSAGREPRARGGRGEKGRKPRPPRAGDQARRGDGICDLPRDVRDAGREGTEQQAPAR